MPNPINIEIADVDFAVSSQYPLLLKKNDSSYNAFYNNSKKDTPDIPVKILPLGQNTPDLQNYKKIFDTGKSWEMFMDGDDYVIVFDSAGSKPRPFWLARMNHDVSKVTIFCGEELIQIRDNVTAISNPVCYPLDQILLMHFLARREGAIFHAAGVDIKGKGYIFPGKSGAGKSTISKQFSPRPDFSMLSDDRVVVRESGGAFRVFGTPWPGDAGIARNASAPLCGTFFIVQGKSNSISEIGPGEALKRLLPVTSIPWYDRETMQNILTFLEEMVSVVPSYELRFKPDAGVSDTVADFVST